MSYPLEKYRYYVAGHKVIAVSTYCGRTVKGVSICHPDDKFDLELGKKIAAARCNVKVAEKRARRAEQKDNEATRKVIEAEKHKAAMLEYHTDSLNKYMTAKRELDTLINSVKKN